MTTPHPPHDPHPPEPVDSGVPEYRPTAPSYGPPPPGYGTPPPGYGPPPAAQPRHAAPAQASDQEFPSRSEQPGDQPTAQPAGPLSYGADPSGGQPTWSQPSGPQPSAFPSYGGQPAGPPSYGGQPAGPPSYGGQPAGPAPSQTPFTPPTGQPWSQPPGGYPAAGSPGSYAPPGGPGGYPPPGQPVKKRGGLKTRIAVGAVSLLVIGGVILVGYLNSRDDVVNAMVGDCVNVVSETDFETVDCSTPEAQYRVLSVFEGLSAGGACLVDPDYDSYISITGDVTKTLCLQTWLQVGDCVGGDGSWTDCASAETVYEVVEVLANSQDDSACPDTAVFSRVYQGENNVICLAETT